MTNYLASGVNSPIPIPEFYPSNIIKGDGVYVIDYDNNKYIDMWMSYGALLFGHADEDIVKIAQDTLKNGWFYSYQTKIEKELSQILHKYIPSAEVIRYATTGSDAVAYAIRAARSYTKRKNVLTIKGGYHGAHEGMISTRGTTINLAPEYVNFNDEKEVYNKLKKGDYACLIVEPILANSGCVPPKENYLKRLREICNETNTVLIFDEIVTGFRISIGGAQEKFGVTPDISTFSKAIASGFPLSVIAGKKVILEEYMPRGDVFFAGTFNGHPLSLNIAKKVIEKLEDGKIHTDLNKLGEKFRKEISNHLNKIQAKACIQGIASMFTIAFGCRSFKYGIVNENYDVNSYNDFISKLAKKGILFPPLPTETVFLSNIHEPLADEIIFAIKDTLDEMKNENVI
jgi:glutamate-1-semialdehyde 2,1-aminomutase